MNTTIYYFTGTGNSLDVARKIGELLGETEYIPITSQLLKGGAVTAETGRVGIVCPVYFSGLPVMVESFAKAFHPGKAGYLFAVVTHGGGGGSAALRQLDGILKGRTGRGLDAGFAVAMPGNYVLMYGAPEGEKRDKILSSAGVSIDAIVPAIREDRHRKLPYSPFVELLHATVYRRFASHVHDRDRQFSVSDECTSCGTCAAVCPAENIELVEGRPVWKHRCELCCGCIHLCPVQAIQAGPKTKDRARYRNPAVGIGDLTRNRRE